MSSDGGSTASSVSQRPQDAPTFAPNLLSFFPPEEVCRDATTPLRKLQSLHQDKWTKGKILGKMQTFELQKSDLDLAHAIAASVRVPCRLDEALRALVASSPQAFESNMRALYGNCYKGGCILLPPRAIALETHPSGPSPASHSASGFYDNDSSFTIPAHVGAQMVVVSPYRKAKSGLHSTPKRQQLGMTTLIRHDSPSRALILTKTLPRQVLRNLVAASDCSALTHSIDHIAACFELDCREEKDGRPHTVIQAYVYASMVPPHQYGLLQQKKLAGDADVHWNARFLKVADTEAEGLLQLFLHSISMIAPITRRRRLGTLDFRPQPKGKQSKDVGCMVCMKTFTMLRSQRFCQLCDRSVCKACAEVYAVEYESDARLSQKRICANCISYFEADILRPSGQKTSSEGSDGRSDRTSSGRGEDPSLGLTIALYSRDIKERKRAVADLTRLTATCRSDNILQMVTKRREHQYGVVSPHQILEAIDEVMETQLTATRKQIVGSMTHVSTEKALRRWPPRPSDEKEDARLWCIERTRMLDVDYDRMLLDLISEVAATKLQCATAYIAATDDTMTTVLGTYDLPPSAFNLPRDQTLCAHVLYREAPVVMDVLPDYASDAGVDGSTFFAGFPVLTSDGDVIAQLCVLDVSPREGLSAFEWAAMVLLCHLTAEFLSKPQ